jgi:hypothetical protein
MAVQFAEDEFKDFDSYMAWHGQGTCEASPPDNLSAKVIYLVTHTSTGAAWTRTRGIRRGNNTVQYNTIQLNSTQLNMALDGDTGPLVLVMLTLDGCVAARNSMEQLAVPRVTYLGGAHNATTRTHPRTSRGGPIAAAGLPHARQPRATFCHVFARRLVAFQTR